MTFLRVYQKRDYKIRLPESDWFDIWDMLKEHLDKIEENLKVYKPTE